MYRTDYNVGDNTLNPEKYASKGAPELQHILPQPDPWDYSGIFWARMVFVALVGLGISLLAGFTALSMLPVMILLSFSLSCYLLISGLLNQEGLVKSLCSAAFGFAPIFLIPLLPLAGVIFLVGVVVCYFLGLSITTSYLDTMCHEARFTEDQRRDLFQEWDQLIHSPLVWRRVWRLWFVIGCAGVLYLLIGLFAPLEPLAKASLALVGLLAAMVVVFFRRQLPDCEDDPIGHHVGWRYFLELLLAWFAYRVPRQAIAVYQGPQGYTWRNWWALLSSAISKQTDSPDLPRPEQVPFAPRSRGLRHALLTLPMFLIAVSFAPLACYFPVTLLYPPPWQELAATEEPEPYRGSLADESTLTDEQRRLVDSMSFLERAAYLKLVADKRYEVELAAHRAAAARELRAEMNASSASWFPVALGGMSSSPRFFVGTILVALSLSILTPLIVYATIFYGFMGPHCEVAHSLIDRHDLRRKVNAEFDAAGRPSAQPRKDSPRWGEYVATIQNSQNETERNSLYLGIHETGQYPVLLPRQALHEHAHIMGDTGSGKTALALAPMATQLVRMSGRNWRDEKRDPSADPAFSAVVIDLKGDPAMFHGLRAEAESAGLDFKFYAPVSQHHTYIFNPFYQRFMQGLTGSQRVEFFLESLSLSHGEGYGRGYFSSVARNVLTKLYETAVKVERTPPTSFRHLNDLAQQLLVELGGGTATEKEQMKQLKGQIEDASQLLNTLRSMAALRSLNASRKEVVDKKTISREAMAQRIDFTDVVSRYVQGKEGPTDIPRKPQVVYFYLPSALGQSSMREIGKLALYSLLNAAVQLQNSGQPTRQVYCFVDEFQQIASSSLEIILRQARSMGISAILANQTISDLKTPDVDLTPTVQANTRFKQFFASSDLKQQDDLIKASGETLEYIDDWVEDPYGEDDWDPLDAIGKMEFLDPRLERDIEWRKELVGRGPNKATRFTRNRLIQMTDDPELSIAHLTRGDGFAQFDGFSFLMRSEFHIGSDEYTARQNAPWPESEHTIREYDTEEGTEGLYDGFFEFDEPVETATEKSVKQPPPQSDSGRGERPTSESASKSPANGEPAGRVETPEEKYARRKRRE